jgi:hypothetical protein
MRISIEAYPRDVVSAYDWIGGILGAAVDRRVAAIETQKRGNRLLTDHFREHHALEFALCNARKYRRNTGRLPKGPDYDQLSGLLIPAQRIHANLSGSARVAFEGKLRDAFTGPNGTRPLSYEVSIATHLMGSGWDVAFADYEGLGRFDFLARRNATEIEIECKTTSVDGGRKIRRQEVNRLGDLILPTTKALSQTAGCHRLTVTVPDRLDKSNEVLDGIASLIGTAAANMENVSGALARVDYVLDDVTAWPEPGRDAGFHEFYERQFGVQNGHILFSGKRNHSVVAILFKSDKPDAVVETIAAQAKEAAKQCSGTRPAIIALHLVDLVSQDELQSLLTGPSGIHTIAHEVFKSAQRKHVDTVSFTLPQNVKATGDGAKWLSGDMIALFNPEPQFACPEARLLFRRNARTTLLNLV